MVSHRIHVLLEVTLDDLVSAYRDEERVLHRLPRSVYGCIDTSSDLYQERRQLVQFLRVLKLTRGDQVVPHAEVTLD